VSFQNSIPEKYQNDAAFRSLLILLHDLDFRGVEINIGGPLGCRPEIVMSLLSKFGLELSMLGIGLAATPFRLSFSHSNESVQRQSVEAPSCVPAPVHLALLSISSGLREWHARRREAGSSPISAVYVSAEEGRRVDLAARENV
jgi:hypothetical protein